MRNLIITLSLIMGGFVMVHGQNAPTIKPNANVVIAPAATSDMKAVGVGTEVSPASEEKATMKRECGKDEKGCGDKKSGRSCCSGKKAKS